jgi:hypothetical protein
MSKEPAATTFRIHREDGGDKTHKNQVKFYQTA